MSYPAGPQTAFDSGSAEPALKLDCRLYRGDKPCAGKVPGVCPANCAVYQPMGHRILIIKLAALGDVIRTAAVLPGLKQAWPQSHITWVTRPSGVRMLANHPSIDRLLPFDTETVCHLEREHFDLCLSLDKEPGPAALAMRITAADRRGIGLSRWGTVMPLNRECAAYFQLGLDDELKFHRNEKSYQQLIYEAIGLTYAGQRYQLYPAPANHQRARDLWANLGIGDDEVVIGLNTGAGNVFANKTWPPEKFAKLAEQLVTRHHWRVALLGGTDEAYLNRDITMACAPLKLNVQGRQVAAVLNVTSSLWPRASALGELDFAAVVRRCNTVVTGDTMAMHVAIAAEVPVVVLFGPTCAQEIELYGHGTILRTSLDCSPCYRRSCDKSPNCMDTISISDVLSAIEQWTTTPNPSPKRQRGLTTHTSTRAIAFTSTQ
ncbi:MAG: glycosyltransferase family 9 protein [Planctomycetota bacterium]